MKLEALSSNLTLAAGVWRLAQSGLLHYTDQGPLYSVYEYRQWMRDHGLVVSMSVGGNCYDNAVAECFFSSLKNEFVHHGDFHTREAARAATFN